MSALVSAPRLLGSVLAVLLVGLGITMDFPGAPTVGPADSTIALIQTERAGERLRVQGIFISEGPPASERDASSTLNYELSVRRSGAAGTVRTSQSGTFETAPGQADTLSTTQVNVQTGDTIDLHLLVRRADVPLDSAHIRRMVP